MRVYAPVVHSAGNQLISNQPVIYKMELMTMAIFNQKSNIVSATIYTVAIRQSNNRDS